MDKLQYEDVEMEVVFLEEEDIIVTSAGIDGTEMNMGDLIP